MCPTQKLVFSRAMETNNGFDRLELNKQLRFGIDDLGFDTPTPVQERAYPLLMSGRDVVGISQTGTGKTLAYMLPILNTLKFSNQVAPRVLILVPTRELVVQVVEQIESYAKYISVRVTGVYGGTNINTQAQDVAQGCDILVGTPGRLYDLTLNRSLSLKSVKKLVIDEVDIMLDLGFRFQLTNIFELLPDKRQNIMFSATMTEDVAELMVDFFDAPERLSIAVSGTPLANIEQEAYAVPNFYTKVNLLSSLLRDRERFQKVIVFLAKKKHADLLFDLLDSVPESRKAVIHSNKSQNYRLRSVEEFDSGQKQVLIATDVMARGLDLKEVSHVICMDTPVYPENYMHRIGRTGRAEQKGHALLFHTEKEGESLRAIESLMDYTIPQQEMPEDVEFNSQKLPEERTRMREATTGNRQTKTEAGPSFHEKKEKNQKTNQGGSYKRKMEKKYKKPQTRGDKNANKKKRR